MFWFMEFTDDLVRTFFDEFCYNGAPFFPAFLFWKLGMYINIKFKSYIMDFNCKQILKEKLFDM